MHAFPRLYQRECVRPSFISGNLDPGIGQTSFVVQDVENRVELRDRQQVTNSSTRCEQTHAPAQILDRRIDGYELAQAATVDIRDAVHFEYHMTVTGLEELEY